MMIEVYNPIPVSGNLGMEETDFIGKPGISVCKELKLLYSVFNGWGIYRMAA